MILFLINNSFFSAIINTSFIEWCIFITAIIYILLAIKENSWCWFFGILSSALSIFLCFQGKLFLESWLQLFYVIIGIYGWYQWRQNKGKKRRCEINSISSKNILTINFLGLITWIPLGILSTRYSTQALPYLDAFITTFSLLATWMTTKKILQNWFYWILIDSLAIVLYCQRSFYLIAFIYFIYTLLAIAGYFKWKKKNQEYFA